ncbi:MAG: hypothetical protein A3B70_01600 [Deltaproteobacteria bacterium RIFCSPHIGHO2_02_FULL_40_11]|nr:MAG: hypothetical protein A3B70_01600 [Deltaproteobacteria bacterium RIFCSPHIGHO2_02_FULL_40_11]
MIKKIGFFVFMFYMMTFVSAFLMAQDALPPEDEELVTIEEELEEARMQVLRGQEKQEETIAEPEPVVETEPETIAEPETTVKEAETVPQRMPADTPSYESNKVTLKQPPAGESPQSWGFTFAGGTYRPTAYAGSGVNFDNVYDSDQQFLGEKGIWGDLSLEWNLYKGMLGKFAPKFTTGSWLIYSEYDPLTDSGTDKKLYALWALPFFGGGVYRAHYWKKQWVVPYMEAGYGIIRLQQGYQAVPADRYTVWRQAYTFGGGIQINANILDPNSAKSFDVNWGVNNTYLILSYRELRSMKKDDFNFSGKELITAGLLFEF